MLVRRFALAIGLLCALLASQLPEFAQQYRQRLGGALDEIGREIAAFDAEAGALGLSREQGVTRLQGNGDTLVRQRGEAMAGAAGRQARLDRQFTALSDAGPVSRYVVLATDLDPGIARRTAADFQPAVPVTTAGFAAAGVGLVAGWLSVHLAATPFRRRRRVVEPDRR